MTDRLAEIEARLVAWRDGSDVNRLSPSDVAWLIERLRSPQDDAQSSVENRRSSGEDRRDRERWRFVRQFLHIERHEMGPRVVMQSGYFPGYPDGDSVEEIVDAALGSSRGDRRTDGSSEFGERVHDSTEKA